MRKLAGKAKPTELRTRDDYTVMDIKHFMQSKAGAARYHSRRLLAAARHRAHDAQVRRRTQSGLACATKQRAVAIGLSYGASSGVSNHIRALHRFCETPTWILPDQDLQPLLSDARSRGIMQHTVESRRLEAFPVVHSHVDPWYTRLAATAAERGAGWVHTYHTLYFEEDWPDGLQDWQKESNEVLLTVAPAAHRRIVVSRWLQRLLDDTHGVTSEFIPNGFDDLRCAAARPATFESRYRMSGMVLYAGGMSPIKNPADFVDLAASMPQQQFAIAGANVSEDSIRALPRNVPSNLRLIGFLQHEELLSALAGASALVLTSHSEGTPTLLLEALSTGCPVVAADSKGTREVLDSGRFGWLYDAGDTGQLVEATRKAIGDTQRVAAAREEIPAAYGWSHIAPRIDRIYRELMR